MEYGNKIINIRETAVGTQVVGVVCNDDEFETFKKLPIESEAQLCEFWSQSLIVSL